MVLNNEENILIIAGEESGDLHGSALITELSARRPEFKFYGICGEKMRSAGVEQLYPIDKLSFLGFVEVLRHIPFIKKVQKDLLAKVVEKKIKTAILIDYPGFNLSLAKKLKSLNVKVIYYISPQIWAWGQKRIKKIIKYVDKMIVLFPFEQEFYKKFNVDVELSGHPLVERIADHKFLTKDELYNKFSIDKRKEILVVFPGSRKNEIDKIFPETIKAAEKLSMKYNLQTVVVCSDNIEESYFTGYNHYHFKLYKGYNYDFMKHACFGIIKSGTSTLEAGILGLPMVIVYKTNTLTYHIAKALVKVKNIGLVNIVIGRQVVKEIIQDDVNESNIISECSFYLDKPEEIASLKNNLTELNTLLGTPGATKKAAAIIINTIYGS